MLVLLVFLALSITANSVLHLMYAKPAIHYIPSSTTLALSVLSTIARLAITTVFVHHALLDIHHKTDIAIPAALEVAHNQAATSILEFVLAALLNLLLIPSTMSVLLALSLTA